MGAVNYLAGFNGSATIGSTTLCITKWSVTETNNLLDVTSTCSAGKMTYIAGLSGCDWSIEANYDGGNPPTVRAGASINLTLDNGVGTQGFSCATAIVGTYEDDLDVAGLVTYKISGKSSGAYTISNT